MQNPQSGIRNSMNALTGCTVIDLTTQLPGPYCSMLLAEFGATVIKVEPPGGDPLRAFPPMFASVNRGKQSISIDLKTNEGRAILKQLAVGADILLEGFRPGVAARLGADYETMRAVNPSIISCSISGFGQDGPYRDRPGHDINYLALGGLLGLTDRPAGRPVVPPVLISDLASGLYAAVAVLAALAYRQATGHGQYIDLSMTESIISWVAPEVARAFADGRAPDRPLLSGLPHYDVFETADGQFLTLGIVYEDHFWRRLCDTLGLEAWRDLITVERMQRADEIRTRLQQIILTRTRPEWDRLLREADVPCGPVYNLDELPRDPQFAHRRVFRDIPSPDGTLSRQVALPFRCSMMMGEPAGPPPGLGEHGRAILRRLGYTVDEMNRLTEMRVVMEMEGAEHADFF